MYPTVESIDSALLSLRSCHSMPQLSAALSQTVIDLGFTYFALTHHAHPSQWKTMAIALHNCPNEWLEGYAKEKLYKYDPILFACTRTTIAFRWDELPAMIDMTPDRVMVLSIYKGVGIGSGMTIPIHIQGEPSGSCNFATHLGQEFPLANLFAAQIIGAFAFQAARELAGLTRSNSLSPRRALTPRQRDCLLWAMRGKSDWEIGKILGLSKETVTQHIDMARARYGVGKRVQLAIRAIYLGDISFNEAIF
jgi:LuxR family transcriptional regulator, quorum-sensing system regulator CciR